MRFRSSDVRQQGRPDAEWTQYFGTERKYSFSFENWLSRRGLTPADITSETYPTGMLTLSDEVASAGVWRGEVSTVKTGEANVILTISTAGSDVTEKAVIKIISLDPRHV